MPAAALLANIAGTKRWKRVRFQVGLVPLVPLFAVCCRRIAFEWSSLRVTVDRDLTFFAVEPSAPLMPGRLLGHVEGLVVEVKCETEIPDWLASHLDGLLASGYSKSRYALALLAGEDRPHLAQEVAREPAVR